jgi:hypothetical protein
MDKWVHWKVEGASMKVTDNARYSNLDRALVELDTALQYEKKRAQENVLKPSLRDTMLLSEKEQRIEEVEGVI